MNETAAASDAPVTRRGRVLEVGLGLIVIGLPLAFLPASASPFVDLKMVLLLAGTLLVVLGTDGVDRLLTSLALLWTAILFVASAFGVDPVVSVVGPDNLGTGLLLLGPCAVLLVCGASTPETLVKRLPLWIMIASLPSAVLVTAWLLIPGTLGSLVPGVPFDGGTLGHSVVVSALCAAGIVAGVGVRVKRPTLFVLAMLILGSGLAVSSRRIGLVAVVVGLLIALLKRHGERKRVAQIVIPVAAIVLLWTMVGALPGTATSVSGVERFFSSEGAVSTNDRTVLWRVLPRAIAERPLVGWGPGATEIAQVTLAQTPEEVAERFDDAHNLFIESVTTSGILGLAALLAIVVVITRRAWRAPRDYGWAAGVAATLLAYHLVQPMGITITALLFLIAGVATGSPSGSRPERTGSRRGIGRWALVAGLGAGLILSIMILTAGLFQRYGTTYGDLGALETANAIAPWRIAGAKAYGTYLALDARAKVPGAQEQVAEIAARLVRDHPDNPRVRLIAADLHSLALDSEGASAWRAEQLALFPADAAAPELPVASPRPATPVG